MNLEPLLDAPLAIQIHVATVLPAAMLGAYLLAGRKGTQTHRLLGRVWVGLMAITAVSSFFIHEFRLIGPFSPIHLLSMVTLASCVQIVRYARQGQIEAHRQTVLILFWAGIGLAGAFTFLPGRIMHRMLMEPLLAGDAVTAAGLFLACSGAGLWLWGLRRAGRFPRRSGRQAGTARS